MSMDTEDKLRGFLQSLMDWAIKEETTDEEKNNIIEIFNFIKDFFSQKKIEQYKEIEFHEKFIKDLGHIAHPKIEELKQKEIELVDLLKKDAFLLDISCLYIKSFEDIILSLQQKNKLQNEINIIIEDLKIEGIVN